MQETLYLNVTTTAEPDLYNLSHIIYYRTNLDQAIFAL